MTKSTIVAIIALFAAGCSGATDKPEHRLSVSPACAQDYAGPRHEWPAADHFVGGGGASTLCTETGEPPFEYGTPIRVRPFTDGSAAIEFSCDRQKLATFLAKNSGRSVVYTAGGVAVMQSYVLGPAESGDECAAFGMRTEDALHLCLNLSDAWKVNPDACGTRCEAATEHDWACVVAK